MHGNNGGNKRGTVHNTSPRISRRVPQQIRSEIAALGLKTKSGKSYRTLLAQGSRSKAQ